MKRLRQNRSDKTTLNSESSSFKVDNKLESNSIQKIRMRGKLSSILMKKLVNWISSWTKRRVRTQVSTLNAIDTKLKSRGSKSYVKKWVIRKIGIATAYILSKPEYSSQLKKSRRLRPIIGYSSSGNSLVIKCKTT